MVFVRGVCVVRGDGHVVDGVDGDGDGGDVGVNGAVIDVVGEGVGAEPVGVRGV